MSTTATIPPGAAPKEAQWLVIIDHREARIYRSVAAGAIPQQIRPPAPAVFPNPMHRATDSGPGEGRPDPGGFYEPVAGVLNGAGKILVFGHGSGAGGAMDRFTAWVQSHRPALAARIIGTQVVDEHQLTEGQLLAKARAIYAKARMV